MYDRHGNIFLTIREYLVEHIPLKLGKVSISSTMVLVATQDGARRKHFL